MLDSQLSELESRAVSLIDSAPDSDALEKARVEFLGRKGLLATIGKDMGKLAAEDRGRIGKLLNAVKQNLEARYESRQAAFELGALNSRLAAEWLDLTMPAPGVRPSTPASGPVPSVTSGAGPRASTQTSRRRKCISRSSDVDG